MTQIKRIALIAHDNCKTDLVDWARYNRDTLAGHELYATGTTGAILADELDLDITRFLSGPLGGDQQVGAAIVEGRVDFVILEQVRGQAPFVRVPVPDHMELERPWQICWSFARWSRPPCAPTSRRSSGSSRRAPTRPPSTGVVRRWRP